MIIDIFTFCYNEQSRLPWFLNHYGPIARKITIFDNGSNDQSEEIGRKWSSVVWDKERYYINKIDDSLLTHLKCNSWKDSDADLVFVGDIDELVYHPDGLINFFSDKVQQGYTMFKPQAYNMVCESLPSYTANKNIYNFKQCTYGVRYDWFDKICVFSPKDVKRINYIDGCHKCKPMGNIKIYQNDPEYKLLHYKYPSKELYTKQISNSFNRLSEYNIRRRRGFEYHDDATKAGVEFDQMYERRECVL